MPQNPLLNRLMARRRLRVITTPDGALDLQQPVPPTTAVVRKPDKVRTPPRKRRVSTSPLGSDPEELLDQYQPDAVLVPLIQLLSSTKLGQASDLLGRGTYGSVYRLVKTPDWLPVVAAVKALAYGRNNVYTSRVLDECHTTMRLCSLSGGHPHLVTAYGFQGGSDKVACAALILELCSHGTLTQWLGSKQLPVPVQEVARQMASALAYCHRNGWAHCDLAPKNVLVHLYGRSSFVLKLCDFSSSIKIGLQDRLMLTPRTMQTCPEDICSISHRAPENLGAVILHRAKLWGMAEQLVMTSKVDAWALGIMLVECALCNPNITVPSQSPTVYQTFGLYLDLFGPPAAADWWVPTWIEKAGVKLPKSKDAGGDAESQMIWPHLSAALLDQPRIMAIVRKLLKWDPNKRLSVCAVDAALK